MSEFDHIFDDSVGEFDDVFPVKGEFDDIFAEPEYDDRYRSDELRGLGQPEPALPEVTPAKDLAMGLFNSFMEDPVDTAASLLSDEAEPNPYVQYIAEHGNDVEREVAEAVTTRVVNKHEEMIEAALSTEYHRMFPSFIQSGLEQTTQGMLYRLAGGKSGVPPDYQPNRIEGLASTFISVLADPVFLLSFGVGGVVGRGVGKAVAARATGVAGRGAQFGVGLGGAELVHHPLRQILADEPVAPIEYFKSVVKSGLTGYAAGAGGAIALLPGEIAAFGTASPLFEGRNPTIDDYLDATAFLLGLKMVHGIGRVAGAKKRFDDKIMKELKEKVDVIIKREVDQMAEKRVEGFDRKEVETQLREDLRFEIDTQIKEAAEIEKAAAEKAAVKGEKPEGWYEGKVVKFDPPLGEEVKPVEGKEGWDLIGEVDAYKSLSHADRMAFFKEAVKPMGYNEVKEREFEKEWIIKETNQRFEEQRLTSIGRDILYEGGLRPYKKDPVTGKAPEWEEFRDTVPLRLRRKTGKVPDDMAKSLGMTESELFRTLESEKLGRKSKSDIESEIRNEIETMKEAEKPTVEEPIVAEPAADAISLQKSGMEELRGQQRREPLDPVEVQHWKDAYESVKAEGLDRSATEIAQSALGGQILNTKELAALHFRLTELSNEYDAVTRESEALRNSGQAAEADLIRERGQAMKAELDLLDKGRAESIREAGRSTSILQVWMDRLTYNIASVHRRAEVNKGGKLTLEQERKLTKLTRELEASERSRLEWERFALTLEKGASKRVASKMVTEESARVVKRKESCGKLRTERDNIHKELRTLGYRVNDITGVTAEGAFLVGKLAVNYIREGAITLDEVVRKVLNDVPDITEYDVYLSLNARNPKAVRKARSETEKRVSQIKTEARLLEEIDDASQGIFTQRGIRAQPLEHIKKLRDTLKKLYSEAHKGDYENKQLERIIGKINEVQDQLKYQHRTLPKEKRVDTEAFKELKQNLRDLRSMMRAEDKLAEYNYQLETGNFEIKPEPVKRTIPPELEQARFAADQAKKQVDQAIDNLRRRTHEEMAAEIIGLPRTIKATADMSYALRQGLILSITRPKLATETFGKAFQAFFSQKTADEIDYEIRSNPNHYIRIRSDLYIGSIDGKILAREEIFTSRIAQNIPLFGAVVKASERNMITGLNLLRVGVFDKFLEHNPNATNAELKAIADYINVASGRGDLGRFSRAADLLSIVIFAPRFSVSKFQTPYKLWKYRKLPRVRKVIAKDMAGFVSTGMAVLALAHLAGARVGLNPWDPDFGKIVIGNTRIDIWGGSIQLARLLARMGMIPLQTLDLINKDLPASAKRVTWMDLWETFISFKASPAVTLVSELTSGRNVMGQEVKPPETLVRTATPFMLEAIYDAVNEGSIGMGFVAAPLEAVGMAVSTYEETESKVKYKRSQKRTEIRNMRKRGKHLRANREIEKWNERYPNVPIGG